MDAQQDFLAQLFSMPTQYGAGVGGIDAYGRNIAASAAQGGLTAGGNGLDMTRAYMDEYRPYDREFMQYVDGIGTDAYAATERARAMGGVQMQTDAQNQQMARQAAAQGISMADPRYAFMRGQQAQQTALSKVMAAMGSDRSTRDEWTKGLGAINAMGLNVGKLGTANLDAATNLGKLGLAAMDSGAAATDRRDQVSAQAAAGMASASASAANAEAANLNARTNAKNSENNYQLGLGKLALDRYGLETGNALNTRKLDDAADANSFSNTFLSSAGGAATNWLVNGGLKTLGNGVSNLFGGGSTNLFDGNNDFSGVTGSNSFDNWATFGSGGD